MIELILFYFIYVRLNLDFSSLIIRENVIGQNGHEHIHMSELTTHIATSHGNETNWKNSWKKKERDFPSQTQTH